MKRFVLDSWPLVAFFNDEPAAGAVDAILRFAAEHESVLLLSLVNWGEIVTAFQRKGGVALADAIIAEIDSLPIDIVPPDRDLTRVAASIRAQGGLSCADAFAAALARQQQAELVTGDPEFRALKKKSTSTG